MEASLLARKLPVCVITLDICNMSRLWNVYVSMAPTNGQEVFHTWEEMSFLRLTKWVNYLDIKSSLATWQSAAAVVTWFVLCCWHRKMASHLSYGRVNLNILREAARKELREFLDKCAGSKVMSTLTWAWPKQRRLAYPWTWQLAS